MSALSRYALPGIIVLSTVGALLMSLLVARYGFPTGDDGDPEDAERRLFVTRFGHALAGVCFAGAAMLAVVALPARVPAPAAPAAGTADAQQVARLAEDVRRIEERLNRELAAIEERLSEAGSTTRERAVAAPPVSERPPTAETPPVAETPPPAETAPALARTPAVETPPVAEVPRASAPPPVPRASRPPRPPAPTPRATPTPRDDAGAALPGQARVHQMRATIQSVQVEVRSRPGPGGTEWVVELTDVAGRPLTGADVTLHGRTAGGAPVEIALQPAEPGAYRVRLPGRGGAPDGLRLRVVRRDKRFDLSLGQEVIW